jgi:hypothetical protein
MQISTLIRTLFPYKTVIAICLLGVTTVNAAEPKIVTDAIAAADWVATALSSSGYKADFTLDSLKEVDRFFDDQAPWGRPKPDGLLSQDLGARIFALGAYVGEVIRRQGEGQWRGDDSDPKAEINLAVQLKSGTIFWPMQRVMKRFTNGRADGIYAYGIGTLRP